MNNAEKKAKEINQLLKATELVKSYQFYEDKIKEDNHYQQLEEEIKDLQQQIVKARYQQDEMIDDIIQHYHEKKKEFEENPLIMNYLNEKEQLNDYLQEIVTFIKQQIEIEP